MITGTTGLGNGKVFASVDHDPTAVSTNVSKGSLILEESTGALYCKNDDGDTTNVLPVEMPPKIVTGSLDVDVSLGTAMLNITGLPNTGTIRRGRFWITANGADVGINTAQPLTVELFATDQGQHSEDNSEFANGRIFAFAQFQFASQDIKVAIIATDTSGDIDDTSDFAAGDLIRIHDGTAFEYQRVATVTDIDTLAFGDQAVNGWSIDEDVTRVMEIFNVPFIDKDNTGEIHIKLTPGTPGGDDVRFHYALEIVG